jgi:predicted Fe-Mo cluster-binding NifX family protein
MRVAFPTNNERTIANHIGLAKGFLIVDTNTGEKFYIKNPVLERINEEHINLKDLPEGERGLGTGRVIPPLLKEAGVDILVARDLGGGMLRNLEFEGIEAYETEEKEIEKVLENLDNLQKVEFKDEEFYPYPRGFGYGRGFGMGYGRRFGYGFGRGLGYGRGFGRGLGYGFGRRFGFGRGFGRRFWD